LRLDGYGSCQIIQHSFVHVFTLDETIVVKGVAEGRIALVALLDVELNETWNIDVSKNTQVFIFVKLERIFMIKWQE